LGRLASQREQAGESPPAIRARRGTTGFVSGADLFLAMRRQVTRIPACEGITTFMLVQVSISRRLGALMRQCR
jgi:hypothetical protein